MPARPNGSLGNLVLAASALAVLSDSSPGHRSGRESVVMQPTAVVREATAEEKKWETSHCQFKSPVSTRPEWHGPITIIRREGYVLGHGAQTKVPYWVCERLTIQDLRGKLQGRSETEPFNPDPLLPEGARAELADYKNSGYARGHMSPDANRTQNPAKDETYFLSNMVPQWGPFNSGMWSQLEARVRRWACSRGTVWVITGPLWYDPQEADPEKADGHVKFFSIGPGKVAVPTHTFKIVLSKKAAAPPAQESWDALGFVMPNREDFPKGTYLPEYLKSIDWIEAHSGFDFFSDLNDSEETALESMTPWAIWPTNKDCLEKQKD